MDAKTVNPEVLMFFEAEHQTFMAGVRAALEVIGRSDDHEAYLKASAKFDKYWQNIKPQDPMVLEKEGSNK